MRYAAAGFAAGVLAVLGLQHAVYFHLRRIYLRRFSPAALWGTSQSPGAESSGTLEVSSK